MSGATEELELIQFHMAQNLTQRGEVRARALRVRSVSREEAWANTHKRESPWPVRKWTMEKMLAMGEHTTIFCSFAAAESDIGLNWGAHFESLP